MAVCPMQGAASWGWQSGEKPPLKPATSERRETCGQYLVTNQKILIEYPESKIWTPIWHKLIGAWSCIIALSGGLLDTLKYIMYVYNPKKYLIFV